MVRAWHQLPPGAVPPGGQRLDARAVGGVCADGHAEGGAGAARRIEGVVLGAADAGVLSHLHLVPFHVWVTVWSWVRGTGSRRPCRTWRSRSSPHPGHGSLSTSWPCGPTLRAGSDGSLARNVKPKLRPRRCAEAQSRSDPWGTPIPIRRASIIASAGPPTRTSRRTSSG